ncbi:MAG: hypothetical protein A2X94_01575 [Bdellovibrionales bacterium GWB1_55_8]|nr:MAG: hypothetical protein A2X94_01575 [Bdellovibrionales bacterium GWB1_55_8]
MAQLVLSGSLAQGTRERQFLIRKKMMTIGTEATHDVMVSASSPGVLFSLVIQDGYCEVLPSRRLRINGNSTIGRSRLSSCDRIEWDGGSAVYLDNEIAAAAQHVEGVSLSRALEVLQNLSATLQGTGALQAGLHQTLDALVEFAGAEVGYLLVENAEGSGWALSASRAIGQESGDVPRPNRKELFSNTILKEALERREPVYVENIIGHPWGDAESVIAARIFSAACFPLCLGERTFGAVFLFTRSPGKSIRRESLGELSLLASQAALMLASQAELSNARRENARLKSLVNAGDGEVALYQDSQSPMVEVARKLEKLARTPLTVLILGETGTGKEVVARELHRKSDRAKGPFVAVNCAAIPAPLLESTLFGFEKGAFTGAIRSQPGKFQIASGGTLFLDEIGDLPLELQAKLLRVLQERMVEPIGARAPLPVDIRVLSATHQELERAVREGRFRQDLYFRLNGATLKIPPLRERREDILPLADLFLKAAGCELPISPDAREALTRNSWSGNVRELQQVITRAGFLAEGAEITLRDLELDSREVQSAGDSEHWSSLEDAQTAFTRDFVRRALERNGGSRSLAAASLGVSERTLYRILASEADPKTDSKADPT